MKFKASFEPNSTAIIVPDKVMSSLGPDARPAVAITINGHTWRSRIALMRGYKLIGVSAANRAAAGFETGDAVEVDVVPDTAPREVEEPADLAKALNANKAARAAFDRLAFGLKQRHVRIIGESSTPVVRARRIAKLVETLAS